MRSAILARSDIQNWQTMCTSWWLFSLEYKGKQDVLTGKVVIDKSNGEVFNGIRHNWKCFLVYKNNDNKKDSIFLEDGKKPSFYATF